MESALFAYRDHATGEAALQRLDALQLPPDSVAVRREDETRDQSTLDAVDEQVTGGLVGNVYRLFGQLMEWGAEPHDEVPYADIVRDGGTVLGVRALTDEDRDRVDVALRETHYVRRTDWRPYAST